MELRTHIRETVKLAVPISFGQLGHIMMGIVDSIMVGKVSYASLAAASLVNGLFFLVIVLGIGMSVAATPLIAIAKGAGKNNECGKILNHSLIVNIILPPHFVQTPINGGLLNLVLHLTHLNC